MNVGKKATIAATSTMPGLPLYPGIPPPIFFNHGDFPKYFSTFCYFSLCSLFVSFSFFRDTRVFALGIFE